MGVSQRVSTHSTLGFSTLIGLQVDSLFPLFLPLFCPNFGSSLHLATFPSSTANALFIPLFPTISPRIPSFSLLSALILHFPPSPIPLFYFFVPHSPLSPFTFPSFNPNLTLKNLLSPPLPHSVSFSLPSISPFLLHFSPHFPSFSPYSPLHTMALSPFLYFPLFLLSSPPFSLFFPLSFPSFPPYSPPKPFKSIPLYSPQGVAWKLRINRGGFKFILPVRPLFSPIFSFWGICPSCLGFWGF